ncbi:VWA domain-containing protein [Clostridium sp. E02]|uniref:VWA domain-containing protein n=1 Tax=Clostridium sp. E02 TaxID=2487134 RepID=UPI000F543B6C|nr:VWA domain-containing protein [Clostridium sp. E02]
MNFEFLFTLGAVFIVTFFVDVFGHKFFKIKRTMFQWVLFLIIGILAASVCFLGTTDYVSKKNKDKTNLYLAYRYLTDCDSGNALSTLEMCSNNAQDDKEMINLIIECQNGDYISAYFNIQEMKDNDKVDSKFSKRIDILNQLCKQMLNIKEDEQNTKVTTEVVHSNDDITENAAKSESREVSVEANEGGQIPELSYDDVYQNQLFEAENKISNIVSDSINLLDVNDKNTNKYEDLYQLDQKINSGNYGGISYDFVMEMLEQYSQDNDIRRLAIKYLVGTKNYENAELVAKELLDQDNSVQNYIIYTDVITQASLDGHSLAPADDKEVAKLLNSAIAFEEKASQLGSGTEKYDKLINEANELRSKASQIDIRRSINYLVSKKPIIFDSDGLYTIQIAKLYLAVDDREKAKELIYEVMDNSNTISESSPIKEPLMKVIDAYNQSGADDTSPLLKGYVQDLVTAESQDVVEINDDTINTKLLNYITSTLKYDKIGIHIGKIDTTNYPSIKAYVNVNGERENIFGLISDFKKDNYEIIDTQYEINDFELESKGYSECNIAIVMDCSGSMQGTPLSNAKVAAKSCIENMESKKQNIAVVGYSDSASLVTAKTNVKATLTNGVDTIGGGGGTNISEGIRVGTKALKGSQGTKAIILLSDGRDGNSQEAVDAVVEDAISNNITIFAVGLGDIDEDYMKNIAESTGGKFILADNSIELEDIYITLQKYIVNNYCFSYTVTNNTDTDPRNLLIGIPEYKISDDKDYTISDGIVNDEVGNSGITKANKNELIIGSVTPNALSLDEVKNGVDITVVGNGFKDGIHISVGSLELKNVKVDSTTSLTGTLVGNVTSGNYKIKAVLPDGRVTVKANAIYVYRAGTTQSIKVGADIITADAIGQISDKNFVASGNVMINGFIHSNNPVTLTAYELPKKFDIKSKTVAYLGKSGALSGDSKLYISYKQAKDNGNVEKLFANIVMDGKDYVIEDGEFGIGINGASSDFDMTLHDFNIQIPFIATIDVADCKLYADRLQINVDELNPVDIIDSIKEGVTSTRGGLSTNKEKAAADNKNKVEKRSEAFNFKGIDSQCSVALTGKNIEVGADVKLEVNNSIDFNKFGINNVDLKLNTLDEDHEYWKLAGGIDFSHIVPGLGGTGVEGLNGQISSSYWCPDKIAISADLKPGISIYNAVYIDRLGLKFKGMSTLFLNSSLCSENAKNILFAGADIDKSEESDIILAGTVGADVNLFKSFQLDVPKEMSDWGTLGEISDGEIGYNFSDVTFYAKADLEILKQQLAKASISFGKQELDINAGANLELSLMNCGVGGGLDFGITSNKKIITMLIGVDGHIDCGWTNFHQKGIGEFKFLAEYDGTYYAVELNCNNLKSKYWYDSDGNPCLWNRFYAEINY